MTLVEAKGCLNWSVVERVIPLKELQIGHPYWVRGFFVKFIEIPHSRSNSDSKGCYIQRTLVLDTNCNSSGCIKCSLFFQMSPLF